MQRFLEVQSAVKKKKAIKMQILDFIQPFLIHSVWHDLSVYLEMGRGHIPKWINWSKKAIWSQALLVLSSSLYMDVFENTLSLDSTQNLGPILETDLKNSKKSILGVNTKQPLSQSASNQYTSSDNQVLLSFQLKFYSLV